MTADPIAPWAEPVLMTAEELLALPEDFWRYELVQGRLVRMPPSGFDHADIVSALDTALRSFVRERGLGRVGAGDPGFILSQPGEPDTVLAPDVAFVSAARASAATPGELKAFPRVAPDLAVEVASPDQHRPEMTAKARMWINAGVKLAWIVWPAARQVDVYRPDEEVVTLESADRLDGGDVLPGFSYPVMDLFAWLSGT